MANSVVTQTILDGPRNCIVKIDGILDTSDLASTVIVDPSTLAGMDNTGLVKPLGMLIDRITYSVEDLLELRLAWDATTPVRIAELDGRGIMKFEAFGGLINNSGAGRTGKLLLSTQGWVASAILSFTLILHMKKQGTL